MTTQPSQQLLEVLQELGTRLDGELKLNNLYRMLYAQDASIYRELPLGVAFPKHLSDLRKIVAAASEHKFSIIPRGGGTSLAGQVVGSGLVVDISRHINAILEINEDERWVRVQPGVVRDDLNRALKAHGLMFAPETSTSSRCVIGGMVANNSCGANSIKYGDTRQHLLEGEFLFADGTLARVGNWSQEELLSAMQRQDSLGRGVAELDSIVKANKALISERYPRPEIVRRNNGYPFDMISTCKPYSSGGRPFSLAQFLCGTEGTLAILTEAKLNLVQIPAHKALACLHFSSIDESLRATQLAVNYGPTAVEIIDRRTLELAKLNREQDKNRFFVSGDPAAIIAVQFEGESHHECLQLLESVIEDIKQAGMGYAYPIIDSGREEAVWELRREGLGIVMGQPGDIKPETAIEDAAVPLDVLPEYIAEVMRILEAHDAQAMVYGHVSVGVVHLRPELNLKDPLDKEKFLSISKQVHRLVKKYRGSISGEHGDGRIRSPYLEEYLGSELMDCHARVKTAFDPGSILNPGIIVKPAAVDQDWRANTGQPTPELPTCFDWSKSGGMVRAVEKCNGVGACRKKAESGGTMCPSFMATLDEKDSTRGRANVFQQLFYATSNPADAYSSEELREALDLCLACKGCKRECPSTIDMTRMKAEFLQGYYDRFGTPLSALFFGHYPRMARLASQTPSLGNWAINFAPSQALLRNVFGLAEQRSLPPLAKQSFRKWLSARPAVKGTNNAQTVLLYIDPFTNYSEPHLGLAAVRLLEAGGYQIELLPVEDDGRTLLSKGLLKKAKQVMDSNARKLSLEFKRRPEAAVVGIEPSALLTFRDEMPDLVSDKHKRTAAELSQRSLLIDEFVANSPTLFAGRPRGENQKVLLHGHCHQKALAGASSTTTALAAAGYEVELLKTGCCGMAGSFGYEKDHYEISMKIGELVLFPKLRRDGGSSIIAAPGTSCRHQILDGTGITAVHPVELLADAATAVD